MSTPITHGPPHDGVAHQGRHGPLQVGESVLLIDHKSRRYLQTLTPHQEFHSHAGPLEHDRLIGAEPGSTHRTTKGLTFTVFRPTLSDLVFKMPRGAQVIYPKDLGPILMLADIAPGVDVLESGVGSGALTAAMLRAGANVTGYELRDDFARRAQLNVARSVGPEAAARYTVQLRDVYEGIDLPAGGGFDRVVLDLPEPWQVVPHLRGALRPGGIVLAYTPSIMQASQFREALGEAGLVMAETLEVLHRTWKVDGAAVRPDHRMVAHTAFLTHARMPSTAERTLPPPATEALDKSAG